MKKIECIVFILISFVLLIAAGGIDWTKINVYEQDDVFWSIQGTEIKYSNPFETNGIMNLFFNFRDTSGTDSVRLRAKFYCMGVSGWIVQDSLDITFDSTEVGWKITNKAIDASDSARVSLEGLAGNKKLYPVLGDVKYKGCY